MLSNYLWAWGRPRTVWLIHLIFPLTPRWRKLTFLFPAFISWNSVSVGGELSVPFPLFCAGKLCAQVLSLLLSQSSSVHTCICPVVSVRHCSPWNLYPLCGSVYIVPLWGSMLIKIYCKQLLKWCWAMIIYVVVICIKIYLLPGPNVWMPSHQLADSLGGTRGVAIWGRRHSQLLLQHPAYLPTLRLATMMIID